MCGINVSRASEKAVKNMNSMIAHRGLPGRSNTYSIDGFHFGQVRLPIMGLSKDFDQPYLYDDKIFLFAGEIYNYKELDPTAKSDVEVLAKMWCECSMSCFYLFDGMWSVIIYDTKSKELHVITDFLAKKPLYIHTPTGSISSEIKALVNFGATVDPYYFSKVNKWGYCIGNETSFCEIKKIPEGTHLVFGNDFPVREEQYIRNEPSIGMDIGIRQRIETAVKNRLVSDIKVGLLLSGGLDSSIIYKIMEKITHDFVIFHIGDEEAEFLNYLDIPSDIDVRRIETYDSQLSDIFEELVFYHLPRLDKLMMSGTIELRSPFLNRQVIDGALNLRYSERYQDGVRKKYLKEIFSDILPSEIISREKLPLKSPQVISGGIKWRTYLSDKFISEVISRYIMEDFG